MPYPYPGYQIFKVNDSTSPTGVRTYCSSSKVKSHKEGATWIAAALEHHGLSANDIKGKPAVVNSQPTGSSVTIY